MNKLCSLAGCCFLFAIGNTSAIYAQDTGDDPQWREFNIEFQTEEVHPVVDGCDFEEPERISIPWDGQTSPTTGITAGQYETANSNIVLRGRGNDVREVQLISDLVARSNSWKSIPLKRIWIRGVEARGLDDDVTSVTGSNWSSDTTTDIGDGMKLLGSGEYTPDLNGKLAMQFSRIIVQTVGSLPLPEGKDWYFEIQIKCYE